MWRSGSRHLAWRPAQLTATQDMNVNVVNRLTPMRAFIQHHPVAIGQSHLLSTLLANKHQMSKKLQKEKDTHMYDRIIALTLGFIKTCRRYISECITMH